MAQVTIYLNNKVEAKVKKLVKEMNVSISKYISTVLEQQITNCWNNSIKNLSGVWDDFSSIEEIRANEQVNDTQREALDELKLKKRQKL